MWRSGPKLELSVYIDRDYAHIAQSLIVKNIGVRANIHLGGRPSFARMDSVGGGQ